MSEQLLSQNFVVDVPTVPMDILERDIELHWKICHPEIGSLLVIGNKHTWERVKLEHYQTDRKYGKPSALSAILRAIG